MKRKKFQKWAENRCSERQKKNEKRTWRAERCEYVVEISIYRRKKCGLAVKIHKIYIVFADGI